MSNPSLGQSLFLFSLVAHLLTLADTMIVAISVDTSSDGTLQTESKGPEIRAPMVSEKHHQHANEVTKPMSIQASNL